MKVCIFGGRDLWKHAHCEAVIEAVERSGFEIDEVVSGGARGIDSIAENYAKDYGLDLTVFHANWKKRGNSAGPHRNNRMADYVDAGIAIPGPDSKGTYHMINALKKRGKPVYAVDWFTHG